MDREEQLRRERALQDRISKKHEPNIRKAIEDAMRAVGNGLPAGGRPDPPIDHLPRITDALLALYREITRATAAAMVGQFKSGFEWIETKEIEEGFYDRLYAEYVQRYGATKISQISEATRAQIRRIIERGLKEGLSLDEIGAELISAAPVLSETRAHIIARTETHSASMYASLNSAKRSTIPLLKEWTSVEDGRTRDFGEGDGIVDEFSHRAMDGVKVPIDDPFEVPTKFGITEPLMFPGDPAGSPANVIGCRCSQTYVPADEAEDTEEPPRPVGKPVTGGARERLLDKIQGEQPIFSQNQADAFSRSNPLALAAIARSSDLGPMIRLQKGAFKRGNQISMGQHVPGSPGYKRVFRHEYGHFLDDEIARSIATRGPGTGKAPVYASFEAVRELAEDGKALNKVRTKVFDGEVNSATLLDQVSKARREAKVVRERITDEVVEAAETLGRTLTPRDVFERYIPEIDHDDMLRLYDMQSFTLRDAVEISVAWERRDVGELIDELPQNLTGRVIDHGSGFAGMQDTFEASTGANVRMWFGHGEPYYRKRERTAEIEGLVEKIGRVTYHRSHTAQAWANFLDAYGDENPATYAMYRRLWPNTAARFEKLLEDYVNGAA